MAKIRVAAVGDLMCGESFHRFGRGPRTGIARLGAEFVDPRVTSILHDHDLVFGNVECVTSDHGHKKRSLRSHQLRATPAAAGVIREWGFTHVNLANNHILEHGREAALETAARLREAGLNVAGAGREDSFEPGTPVSRSTVGDVPVSLIAGCLLDEPYAFAGGATFEGMVSSVRSAADSGDLVIVSLHWGTEYMHYPDSDQRRQAEALVDAGASVILGHHPHVCQGVQRIGASLVAYSMGNFVFDQIWPDTRWSAILSLEIDDHQVADWKLVPIFADEQHRPTLATDQRRVELENELGRRNTLLESEPPPLDEYRDRARRIEQRNRRRLWRHTLSSALRLPPDYSIQLFLRPVLRRIGRW